MKRSLAAMALGMAVCAGPFPPPVLAQPGQAVVIADRVNVRSRPALAGEVVAKLDRGRTVTVLEEGLTSQEPGGQFLEWTRIALPEGARAWVAGQFVDAENGVVKATRLNVRSGPSEDFGVLGALTNGAPIRVLGETNGWLELAPPAGLSAYIASQFLETSPDNHGKPATPPPSSPSETPPKTSPATPTPDSESAPGTEPANDPVPNDGRDQTATAAFPAATNPTAQLWPVTPMIATVRIVLAP